MRHTFSRFIHKLLIIFLLYKVIEALLDISVVEVIEQAICASNNNIRFADVMLIIIGIIRQITSRSTLIWEIKRVLLVFGGKYNIQHLLVILPENSIPRVT